MQTLIDCAGKCKFCLSGKENLCSDFIATGRDAHGGYAEYMLAKKDFIYKIPGVFTSLLEEFLVSGYGGSAGIQVPEREQRRLAELRALIDGA